MTKIYFAGDGYLDIEKKYNVPVLISYLSGDKKEISNLSDVFLDSGAFTAFTCNTNIDLKEYITYLTINKKYLTCYASLDVIGSAKKSYDNWKLMCDMGLKPIPAFHVGEDYKWLKHYCEETDYIALGGMVPHSKNQPFLRCWLNKCFSIIPNAVKVHGFGLTNTQIIKMFPFYSIDSTSWLAGSRFGSIYKYSNGNIKSISIKKFNNLHYKKRTEWNIIQWKLFADYMETYHSHTKLRK